MNKIINPLLKEGITPPAKIDEENSQIKKNS